VAKVLPQISRQGREYLEKIARALFLLQNTAIRPLAGKKAGRDAKEPVEDSHSP
jgi:hypothetical protein